MKEEMLRRRTFTSPEEALRLLKLGLPRSTADMYFTLTASGWHPQPDVLEQPFDEEQKEYPDIPILPCWSGLRLIEMAAENMRTAMRVVPDKKQLCVTSAVEMFETKLRGQDFSKWKV